MFRRLLLFEKNGDAAPVSIGSLLVIPGSPDVMISPRELVPALGREYYISTDGTAKNLQKIETKVVPLPAPPVPPFAYLIKPVK